MRLTWRAALAIVLSAGLLYLALRGTNWSEVGRALRESNAALWIAATIVSQLTFPLRAIRWRSILEPIRTGIPFGPLWRSTAIGMAVNNTALARAGEIVRAYALTRERVSVTFPEALASLVVDRVFDSLVVLGLLLVALLDPTFSAGADVGKFTFGTLIALLSAAVAFAFAALYFAVFRPEIVGRIAERVTLSVAPKWTPRVEKFVGELTRGLAMLRSGRLFATVLVLTIAHWLVNAAAFWLGFLALGIDVPLTGVFLVQGLIVVAVALPQGPGFFGAFEAAAKIGLGFYAINESIAFAWGLTYHVLTLIPITTVGLFYAAKLGVRTSDAQRARTGET